MPLSLLQLFSVNYRMLIAHPIIVVHCVGRSNMLSSLQPSSADYNISLPFLPVKCG